MFLENPVNPIVSSDSTVIYPVKGIIFITITVIHPETVNIILLFITVYGICGA